MKNLLKQQNKKGMGSQSERGFTLVETLVALSIFSISILGLMIVLSDGVADIGYAKSKNTATYLAGEGVEYIRNMRDTYVLYAVSGQVGWDAFKTKITLGTALCDQANGCYFDDQSLSYIDSTQPIIDVPLIACGTSCPPLLYDIVAGKYGYLSGSASNFIRKIKIEVIGLDEVDEVKVSSTVFWTQGSQNYQISFSESLFNWIE